MFVIYCMLIICVQVIPCILYVYIFKSIHNLYLNSADSAQHLPQVLINPKWSLVRNRELRTNNFKKFPGCLGRTLGKRGGPPADRHFCQHGQSPKAAREVHSAPDHGSHSYTAPGHHPFDPHPTDENIAPVLRTIQTIIARSQGLFGKGVIFGCQ